MKNYYFNDATKIVFVNESFSWDDNNNNFLHIIINRK